MNRGRREQLARRYLRLRILLVGVAFAAAFVALVGRAVDLQVLKQDKLAQLARREFLKRVKIPPRRGIIYDRNQVELAVSLDTESVFARPVAITDPRGTALKLSRVLGVSYRRLVKKLKSERGFVWVARRVSPAEVRAVRALKLKGVGLVTEPRRFYPFTNLACHVLGFAGLDARGLEGLERKFDRVLRGSDRTVLSLRDALGRTIQVEPAAYASLPEGHHLILTLDKNLQYRTEKILAETVAKYRAKGGQAIVMAPQTGEILALASVPGFNPNVYGSYPPATWRNRAVTDTFEPGSTFKVFVAAAALASQKITLEQLFDCERGQWRIGGRVIHDTHPHGRLNLADIVKYSSNIGAAKVGMTIGARQLYRTLKAFGFGSPTGVDLPGESRGILRPVSSWRPVELANICFGQGVAVTPLQLLTAVAAVANGGVLMRPFVVRAEIDQHARLVRETQPQARGRALGAREARLLTSMMVRVTEPGGTGTLARVEPFKVAGKTGTAQKVKPGGGYSRSDYMSSFVGFLPADDPKVAVLVVIDTPRGSHYGGVVAGPAFARIARAALAALGMQPAPPVTQQVKAGPGRATGAASPEPPTPLPSSRDLKELERMLAAGRVPDLRGLTLRQVMELARRAGTRLEIRGWGRVARQEPKPGGRLAGRLELVLLPPQGEA